MHSRPSWSIITVTYNSSMALRAAWGAWVPAEGVEWIVVDNHSQDRSAAVAEELGADRVMVEAENRGFGAANNIGLAAATGRWVLFANPDLTVNPIDLGHLGRCIDERGGLVAPQLLNMDGSPQPNGRGYPTLANKIRHRLMPGRSSHYQFVVPLGETRDVCFVMGAAVAGTREEFVRLDGWDERFFVYYEDSDICLREWLTGGRVSLAGDVRWRHAWARETASFHWRPWLLELRAMATFYARYPNLLTTNRRASGALPGVPRQLPERSAHGQDSPRLR